jgi:hypothetical protein
MKWEGPVDYWLTTTGPGGSIGINGAIVRRKDFIVPYPGVTIDVASVDEFTAKIVTAGGKVIAPKHIIPGAGCHAYCADPFVSCRTIRPHYTMGNSFSFARAGRFLSRHAANQRVQLLNR